MPKHPLPVAGLLLAFLPPLLAQAPAPPVAKRVDHKEQWHGREFVDPWFWLRERQSPDVVGYLEAENGYTAAMTAGMQPFQQALYTEMVARVKQTDLSVPVRDGRFYYYSRTVDGLQYGMPRLLRRAGRSATRCCTGSARERK